MPARVAHAARLSMPARFKTRLLLLALGLSVAVGCRKQAPRPAQERESDEPSAQQSAEPAQSAAKPTPVSRCREPNPGALYSVGDTERAKRSDAAGPGESDEERDEPIAMPFGVELGGVVGHPSGFAVGLLQSLRRGQRASVALIGEGGSGRTVELGEVHGDVEAPLLALGSERIVALFGDQDAAGATLRTAVLAFDASRPSFGPDITSVDRSSGAALAASGTSAVIACVRIDKGKSRLVTFQLSLGDDKKLAAPTLLEPGAEAESPRLIARPGGYWLGWVEQQPMLKERSTTPKTKPKAESDDVAEEQGGLALGPRGLKVVALDAAGKPQGSALSLTKGDSHVLAYELAPWSDGGVVVAWRDDPAAPGVEGGALQLAHVRPDGSVESGQVEDSDLGAGIPSLIVDPAPRSPGQSVWLAAGGGNEPTRFGLLTGGGVSVTELAGDKLLGFAELVGARAGRLLAARPRQTAQDLFVLECEAK